MVLVQYVESLYLSVKKNIQKVKFVKFVKFVKLYNIKFPTIIYHMNPR
jgi:hypothetical protein